MESDNCFLYLIKIHKKHTESVLRVKRKFTIKQMWARKSHIPLQINAVTDILLPPPQTTKLTETIKVTVCDVVSTTVLNFNTT